MNEEYLKGLFENLGGKAELGGDYQEWSTSIATNEEYKKSMYESLGGESALGGSYDDWNSGVFGDVKKKDSSELPDAVAQTDSGVSPSVSEDGQSSLEQDVQLSLEERLAKRKSLPIEEQIALAKQDELRPFYEAQGLNLDDKLNFEAIKKSKSEEEKKEKESEQELSFFSKLYNRITSTEDLEEDFQTTDEDKADQYLANNEDKIFEAEKQYNIAKAKQITEVFSPDQRKEQFEEQGVDLGYMPTSFIKVNGEDFSVKELQKNLYDSEFIDKLQSEEINVDIDNSIEDETLQSLIDLRDRQKESGGQWGDIAQSFYAGALDLLVAGPLEAVETIVMPRGYKEVITSVVGGTLGDKVNKYANKVRENTRVYQEEGMTKSLLKGNWSDAMFQTGNALSESAPLILGMYASAPLKLAEGVTLGFAGVSAGGLKSLELKEQRLKGEIDMSDAQILLNSALTGGAEAFFERFTLDAVNASRKVFALGKITPGEIAEGFTKGFLRQARVEGLSEGATELSNMFTDLITRDIDYEKGELKDTAISLEDVAVRFSDAAMIGSIMGGGIHTVPYMAKSMSKFKILDENIAVLFTMEDGSTQSMSRADALKFVKNPEVAQKVRSGAVTMDASMNDIAKQQVEEILYGFYAPDAVASREVMREKEGGVQSILDKIRDTEEVSTEDVNSLSQAVSEMEAEGKKSKYNISKSTKATRDKLNAILKQKGIQIVDAVASQDVSMSKVTETVDATKIDSQEQYDSVKKQLEDGKKKPTVVQSQNQSGIKVNNEVSQTSEITQGKFKSVAAARNAMKDFEAKRDAAKKGEMLESDLFPANNKLFLKTKKETLDEIPQEVIDNNDYHVLTSEKEGLTEQERASRMESLKSMLDEAGATYYTVQGVYNGVAEESLVVTGIDNATALNIGNQFQQESIFSSKDGLMFGDGRVVPLDGDMVKGPDARKRDALTIMNVGGRKVSMHTGLEWANTSYGKNFNSDNIHKLDESNSDYDAELFQGLDDSRKRALGFAFKLLNSIGGLNVTVVRNSKAMEAQLEAIGQDPSKKRGSFFRGSDKTIYVNLETVQGNTLFHEIIHPMVDFIKKTDPALYKRIEAEVKESDVKRRVMKNGRRMKGSYLEWAQSNPAYEGLSEEGLIEEAFAEMMGDAAYGHFINKQSTLSRIREVIRDILSRIGITSPFDNVEAIDLNQMSLSDIRTDLAEALINGRKINVGGVEFEVGESKSDIREQAVELLTQEEDLTEFGLDSEKRNTLRELGTALDARQRKEYKVIDKDTRDDKASDYISDFIKDEVIYSIDNVEDSGAGWYEEKYDRALDNMAQYNDFMKKGEPSRDLFTMLLAITSDGQEVSKNLEYSERLTKEYVETGSIDVDKINFGGTAKKSIRVNVKNISDLLNQFDGDILKVKEFLTVEKSVSEFKKDFPDIVSKSNYEMTGAPADKIKLPMAAMIFGPKLGAFYGNLTGGSGYLTMDRWFNRTFNRYRGIVKTPLDKSRYDKAREAILKLKDLEKKYNLNYGIKLSSSKNLSKDKVVSTAQKVASLYVKDNKRRKSLPKEIKSNESLLNSFSKDYAGLQDAPFGKRDRTFMYESVWKAQEKLSKEGYEVTVADIQAILWYFEKSLYKKFNVQGPPIISYEEVTERAIPDIREQSPQVEEVQWQKSKIGRGDLAITNRREEVREAAQDYFDGKINQEEYLEIVQENSPIKPITQFIDPASLEDIETAVGSKVEGRLDVPIQEGTKVGLRLDIPAYTNKNIWAITVHEDGRGKAMSYTNVARIDNVEFISSPKVALGIARGKLSKSTIARMLGNWSPIEGTDAKARGENAKQIVTEVMNDPSWSQVGMNPFRHSYFYDRLDGMPVVGAEQVVQIGGLVYAKNAEKTTPFDERFEDKRTGLRFQIPGEEVANEADEMGTDQGGFSEFTLDQIASENYEERTLMIEDILNNDKYLKEYIEASTGIREYDEESFMPPIISSNNEVLDGYNRIHDAYLKGDKSILVYQGVSPKLRFQVPTYDMEYTPNALISLSMLSDDNRRPEQWVNEIGKGVKGASKDVDTMGLLDLLKAYKKEAKVKSIPKEVVSQLIATNMADIETKILGGDIDYDNYDIDYDGDTYSVTTPDGVTLRSDMEVVKDIEDLTIEEANSIIEETLKAENLGPVYSEVTLPGGENYREFLIKDKSSEDIFTAPHYYEFGENLIASARVDDRVGPNGEKILFVQEIQSDWVQGTNKENFAIKSEIKELESQKNSLYEEEAKIESEKRKLDNLKAAKIDGVANKYSLINNFKKLKKEGNDGSMSAEEYKEVYVDTNSDGITIADEIIQEYEEESMVAGMAIKGIQDEISALDDILYPVLEKKKKIIKKLNGLRPYLPWNQTDLWVGLTIRKLINQASKEGYDQIAFVNGEQSDVVQSHTGNKKGLTHKFYNKIVPKNINNELKRLVKGMKYGVSEFMPEEVGKPGVVGDFADTAFEDYLESSEEERQPTVKVSNKNAVINLTPELKAATDKVGPLRFQAPQEEGETNVYTSGLASIAWDISKEVIDADYAAGRYLTGFIDQKTYKSPERERYDIRLSQLLAKPFGTHSDAEVKEIMVRSKGDLHAELLRVDENSRLLREAMKDTDITPEQVNDLLHNLEGIKAMEKSDLRTTLLEMRTHIDALSKTLIREDLIKGQTMFTVDANMNVYVTRSYRQFETKGWTQTDNDITKKAKDFLYREAKNDNPNASEERLQEIAEVAYKKLVKQKDFVKFSGGSTSLDGLSRVTSIFKEKKVIPEEIRNLWGEIDNPLMNYSNTISKIAKTISAERMYRELNEIGQGKFISDVQTPELFYELEGEKWGSLKGKFVDTEMFSVMNQINSDLSKTGLQKVYDLYMQLVLFNKKMKTVWNPGTHAKNIVGNSSFAMMNGHLSTDLKQMYKDGKLSIQAFKTMKDSEFKELYEKLTRLGVVNSSASLMEIKNIAEDIRETKFDLTEYLNEKNGKIQKRMANVSGTIKEGVSSFDEKLMKAYQAEDDVWKIFGYLSERGRYIKAGLDVVNAEEMAAKNIRNLYPNYNEIPRIIRFLGRSPLVGSFVAFQAESVRNAKNTIMLGFEEIGSDNPKIKKIGATRIAGTIATMTLMESLQLYTAQFLGEFLGFGGEDDEDVERRKMRLLLPEWDAPGNIAYMFRGFLESKQSEDQTERDRYFDYINFSSISGVGYIKDIMRLAFTDIDTKLGQDTALNILEKIYAPFLGEEMTGRVMLDAVNNKGGKIFKDTDGALTKLGKMIIYVGDKTKPGGARAVQRGLESVYDVDSDLVPGYEMLAVFGIRISRVNVNKGLAIKSNFLFKDMVSRVGKGILKDPFALREEARSNSKFNEDLNKLADLIAAARLNSINGENVKTILYNSRVSKPVIEEAYNRYLDRYLEDAISVDDK